MRFVAINTEAQQDTQMLHRIRTRLVSERTALINQVRGLLGCLLYTSDAADE